MEEILTVLVGASPVLIAVVYLGTKLLNILDKHITTWAADRVVSVEDREKIIKLLGDLDERLDLIEGRNP